MNTLIVQRHPNPGSFKAALTDLRAHWTQRLRGVMDEPPLRFPGCEDWGDIGRAVTEPPHRTTAQPQMNV